jgi:hypothetical protein
MTNRIRTIYKQLKEDSTLLSLLNPFIENEILKFELNNSQSILNYDNWIMNAQKENYLQQPIYTLHEVKNRESANTIVAKVKWIYDIKGVIGKSKVISVFIASTSKFPKGLKDKKLLKNTPIIIKEYFNKVSPPFEIDQNHCAVADILNQTSINLTGKQIHQLSAKACAFSFFISRFAHSIITDFQLKVIFIYIFQTQFDISFFPLGKSIFQRIGKQLIYNQT